MCKQFTKRSLSFLLALVMLLSLAPFAAFATEAEAAISEDAETAAEPCVTDYETFIMALAYLEEVADAYVMDHPGKDPLALVIKYIRTGVDRYNSGSWGIMAGYEDADFAAFVKDIEDMLNSEVTDESEKFYISALKNIDNFCLPNGDYVDIGHMFGTMDISYHNKSSVNHADVAGWAGDLVDLLSTADRHGVSGTLEEMVTDIRENYLGAQLNESDVFSMTDMYGDLDGYYVMQKLYGQEYEMGTLYTILMEYFTEELTDVARADFFLRNRLDGSSTRVGLRELVYNTYLGNKLLTTLEGTREFVSEDINELRKACCYAFADYICELAGDYVEATDNPYFDVFSSDYSTLAPGITQEIKYATSADDKQLVYYIATADIRREDVHVYANYKDNDPSTWGMARVADQMAAAQAKYGDPESELYIENYNVIAGTNGDGYNMSTGEPGGLLMMNGIEYHPVNASGFFAILKDGSAVIGTKADWENTYKSQAQEAIGAFGTTLIRDGKICITATSNYYSNRASRTAVGITRTGKVVLAVLDGRQEPFSCGGSMEELAQVMLEAGCVDAVNLDGGGSTTYVAKQEGTDEFVVVNRPSDGSQRSVSTSLMIVSTAPSSTAFDHAILETATDYLTLGASMQITPTGVSATGNAAELPEGTTWAVSDEKWGTITEDGLFTAKRLGDVEVSLLLDGSVIGSKTLHIVVPDRVNFSKNNLNAVYGETVELPLVVLYAGKKVTVSPSDIVFTLSSPNAGVIDGFSFIGAEGSGIKNVTITAALAGSNDIAGSITVSLYSQGEASFDFEQAVGGDRQLAWDRQISNATTEDNITYSVVNGEENMVTSYTFAIDMTQIPIPQRLSDLTSMLPGADLESASAWTFLLQLAERVSTLSEVKATLYFDPSFDVDYSGMTVLNEYFLMDEVTFDEATNTLSVVMKWKDQTQAIDPDTANPLCIVSGIKLTPKDEAAWDSKGRLTPVNTGNISYKIYLRASSLYSFCLKEENQQIYGLMPFVNPDNESEKGGYFGDVYADFEDSYTLIKVLKNGWINEGAGFAYYDNGEKYFGIRQVDGLYYDFGENGLCPGQATYTGLLTEDGKTYYIRLGEVTTGWQLVGDTWYLFDWVTGVGYNGTYVSEFPGVSYEIDNGRLVSGVWLETEKGLQYYYGPYYYKTGWKEIDGETYFFKDYYAHTGVHPVRESGAVATDLTWYEFTDKGALVGLAADGLYWFEGELYYVVNARSNRTGLYLIGGSYYYFRYDNTAVRNQAYWVGTTGGYVTAGTYRFDASGKMIMTTELVDENGTLYYYENGRRTANAGLLLVDGSYYYIGSGAMPVKNQSYWVSKTNGYVTAGTYRFGADGKMNMSTEVASENGSLYYYENGRRTPNAGLVYFEGYYYFIGNGAIAVTDTTLWVEKTNGHFIKGTYTFDADGRMLIYNGIVDGYYYVDGEKNAAGLIEIDGSYYFADGSAKIAMNCVMWVSKTNGYVSTGTYRFDAEGKMIMTTEMVNENGTLYYYRDGRRTDNAGLIEVDGSYYYIGSGAIAVTDRPYWVGKTNGYNFTVGTYRFDEEGKMLLTTELVNENGTLYYYENGRRTSNAGLILFEGSYYFISDGAIAVVSKTLWVEKTNGHFIKGTYTFDAQGKMIIHNGIVDGYYYVNGEKKAAGLVEIDGYYYYAAGSGKIIVSQSMWVSNTNGYVDVGTYRFDQQGRMIMTTELVNENGTLYYYFEGKRTANAGLILLDGSYYYIGGGAIAVTDKPYWVSKTNGCPFSAGTYRFDEEGKMLTHTYINNESGTLYYYQDGRRVSNAGLILLDGCYYHVGSGSILTVNATIWVERTNGLMSKGTYTFDSEGRMILD